MFVVDYTDLTEKVKDIRKVLDGIQLNLYNQFRPDFCSLKGLSIIDDHSQSPNTIIKLGKCKVFKCKNLYFENYFLHKF